MSVMMINCLYSIMSHEIGSQFQHVGIASFIDDAKLWVPSTHISDMVDAFHMLSTFDKDIGQVPNMEKTVILTRKVKKGKWLKKKLNLLSAPQKKVKSLGRVHAMSPKAGTGYQSVRVSKALQVAKKVAYLPIPSQQKEIYIHAHVHSAWIFGTETQGPSKDQLQSLRIGVANIFDPSKHKMRSPALLMASARDVFLDPFAKWFLRVFTHVRKLCKFNPYTARRLFNHVSRIQAPTSPATNGIAYIFAYLLNRVGWRVESDEDFSLRTSGGVIRMTAYSNNFFQEILGDCIRTFLCKANTHRQEYSEFPEGFQVDACMTRFLHDSPFRSHDDFDFLKPFLQRLPQDAQHAKNLLRQAQSGRIFTAPRLKAAGLAETDQCPACRHRESFHHLFCSCQEYANTRPDGICSYPMFQWATGIILSKTCDILDSELSRVPVSGDIFVPSQVIFVDGSCFARSWPMLRTAASVIYIPGWGVESELLPGSDASSQRAEIFALFMALRRTLGSIDVASDCQSVVKTFQFLQQMCFAIAHVQKLDNWDLWVHVCQHMVSRCGHVNVFKVKAHVNKSFNQSQFLTDGNEKADLAAKAAARERFLVKLAQVKDHISRAVDLQTHIVSTLLRRSEWAAVVPWLQPPVDDFVTRVENFSSSCRCVSGVRLRAKTRVCNGSCQILAPRACHASVEESFHNKCCGGILDHQLWSTIKSHYVKFKDAAENTVMFPTDFGSPCPLAIRKGLHKYPLEYAKAVIQYLQQAQISFDSGPQASKIPWTLVFLDFALQFPSVIQTSSNLHTLVCQFRARVVRLCKVLSISVQPYRYCYLLDQFNLGRLSGFVGSFSPVDSPRLWFLLVDSSFQVSTSVRVKQDVFLHLDSALNIPLG